MLRTVCQEKEFRERYAAIILARASAIEAWFNSLPLFTWVPLRIRPDEEEVAVGILCLLYIESRICLTFSSDLSHIQRGTRSIEEYRAWIDTNCYRPAVDHKAGGLCPHVAEGGDL